MDNLMLDGNAVLANQVVIVGRTRHTIDARARQAEHRVT